MRSKGEGTVQYRSESKTWFAKVPVGKYANGKTKYKQVTASSRAKAERMRLELIGQRDQGVRLDRHRQTFRKYAEWYYSVEAVHKNRSSTIGNYQHLLERHVFPIFGERKLDEITRQDLLAHLNKLRQKYKPSTVNQVKAAMSAVYRSAVLNDLVDHNPCRDIPRFNLRRDETLNVSEPWTVDEAQAALTAVRGTEFETFLVVMLHTGMRVGECLALHWDDVDFEEQTIHIGKTLREETITLPDGTRSTMIRYNDPKTRSGNRINDLGPSVIEALRRTQEEQNQAREWSSEWFESGCVFANEIGSEVWPSNFSGRFRRWLKKEPGLRYIRIHDIRHTFAHLAAANGVSFEAIQDALGHSSPTITKSIYGSGIAALRREATQTVGHLLGGE